MKVFKNLVVCAAALMAVGAGNVALAAEAKADELDAVKKNITAALQSAKPGIEVSHLERAPIAGMYKATIAGGPSVFITKDGQYFIAGDMFQVGLGKIVNLTEQEKNGDRAKAVASVDKKDMIIFSPKGEAKKAIYVFTDVDCGYCQKLHHQIAGYNELGIEIRYLAYPRAGIHSNSYKKIASAWCADDKQAAMTKLKNREPIEENVCKDNPVADQFMLGQSIGLTGTPALVTEEGELIAGYVDPSRLAKMLDL